MKPVHFFKKYLLPLMTGLLLSLSLFDHFEFLVLMALIPLFISLLRPGQNLKYYFACGFLSQLLYVGTAFFWIQSAGKTYFLLNPIFSFLFYILFISIFSLHWGLVGVLFGWAQREGSKYIGFALPFFLIFFDEVIFRFFPFHFGLVDKRLKKSWMQKNGEIVNRIPRFASYFIVLFFIGLAVRPHRNYR